MFRVMLRAAVAALALLHGAAFAQEAPEKPPESSPGPPAEMLVVTGSRIGGADAPQSNPVVSIGRSAIEYSGITNVIDLLKRLPALVNSQDSNDSAGSNPNNFAGGTGLNLLNLRNLGIDRTLVLVNGRRHVASVPGSAAVDINTIPVDLIERIDVMTGGASAIYGADGVSGVVNFILRDNFSGLRVRTQYGQPQEGGNKQGFFSATAARNFADGRGNLAVAAELSRENRLRAFERPYSGAREVRFVRNPDDPGDDPAIPDYVPLGDLRWFGSGRGGAVDVDFDFGADFDGTTDAPWNPGNYPGGIQSFAYAQGGSATPVGGYSGDLLPRENRIATNVFGHYDLTDKVRLFTELKFVATKSLTRGQPTYDGFLWIDPDNPFIPPNIAAASGGGPVLVSRDNFDFGIRGEDIERKTYRAVLGLEGDVTEWLRYNVSAVYGETDVDASSLNNRFNDRFAAALDAVADPVTGQPVCRSTLDPSALGANVGWQGWAVPTSFTPGPGSGCVPIDIFGEGSPSQAAIDWIMTDSLEHDIITQKVATAYVSGDFDPWFKLPGGSLGFALGAEWRKETTRAVPAMEDQLGLTFGNMIGPTRGQYEVSESFAEINVPLVRDRPFFQALSLDAAERYSRYSTIGGASTWKVGLMWAPVQDVLFRATIASAVRAPNIGELFSPAGQTFLFISDPCDPLNLGLGTQYRAANCTALLTAAGADPNTFADINTSTNVAGILKGNASLREETADTSTVGVVLRPRFAPGLVLSADYYDIDLTQAINTLDPQEIAEQCVDLPTLDNQFCNLIARQFGGVTAGGITGFTIQPVNVARFRTQGYDFSLAYLTEPGRWRAQPADWGVVGVRLVGNYLKDLFFVNLPGADPDPDKGEKDVPRRQLNLDLTWERGPVVLNYGLNYFGRTQRFTTAERTLQPDIAAAKYLDYHARVTHDVQARYTFAKNVAVYAGVNNLGNQQPDLGDPFYPVSAAGRFFYGGVTFNDF